MAKFCKYCGSPLEEGQVCACQSAPAAPEAPVAVAQAPEAAPAAVETAAPAGNALVSSLKNTVLGYWKSPKAAAAGVAADSNGMAVAGIFAGIHLLAVFFFIWTMLGQLINILAGLTESLGEMMGQTGGMIGEEVSEILEELDIAWPILPMLVSALVIAVVCIAVSALVVYAAAKINKQEADLKALILTQAVHTIAPSALLLVGLVLGLITWELQVIVLVISLVLWFINICTDVQEVAGVKAMESGKTMAIQTVVVAVALGIAVFAISKLFGWCVEEYVNAIAEAIEDATSDALGGLF